MFNYCFYLASKGKKPTYQKLAEKFDAYNDTVGPLLKQWEELHAQQPDWPLPESVRERLEETIVSIWRIAPTAAMGQLQVQAQLLKDEVEQKTVQMKALQQALNQQVESLTAKDAQLAVGRTTDGSHGSRRSDGACHGHREEPNPASR